MTATLASLIIGTITGIVGGPPPTVGMEDGYSFIYSGAELRAKPFNDKSPIVLQIYSKSAAPDGTEYQLGFIGMEPGTYDLRDYLESVDGVRPDDLPAMPVTVKGLLPPEHQGQLESRPPSPPRNVGGYLIAMSALAVIWIFCFIPLMRKRSANREPVPEASREPGFADYLRPLIARAAAGDLTGDEKAQVERLLLLHWRGRLHLEHLSMADSMSQLHRHDEAGQLLRALEDWLHRPPGAVVDTDIAELLRPYERFAVPEPAGEAGVS